MRRGKVAIVCLLIGAFAMAQSQPWPIRRDSGRTANGTALSLSSLTVTGNTQAADAGFNNVSLVNLTAGGTVSAAVLDGGSGLLSGTFLSGTDLGGLDCAYAMPTGVALCGDVAGAHTLAWSGSAWQIDGASLVSSVVTDWTFAAYDGFGLTTTAVIAKIGSTATAATLIEAAWVQGLVGVGGTTQTVKLCDAANCAATIFATCTPTCTSAAGTQVACTVNTAAVPKNSALFWVTTATTCTTDSTGNVTAHFSESFP